MLTRLAPLAFVVAFASCKPDTATCPLVGTWRVEDDLSDQLVARITTEGDDVEQIRSKYKHAFVPDGHAEEHTFTATGQYGTKAWIGGGYYEGKRLSWSVLDEDPDRVEINIQLPVEINADGTKSLHRIFVFESPDVIREDRGLFRGMRYFRVPHGK